MHGVELNSVRGSEFCETLTGGFTREFPRGRAPTRVRLQRSGTLRALEFPEEWNSQGSGTPRGVELAGGWNSQGGGTPRGVELPEGWNSQGGGTPRRVELPGKWNSQGRGVELPGGWNTQGRGTLSKAKFKSPGLEESYANSYTDFDRRPRVEINLSDLRNLKASHDSLPHEGFSSCSGLLKVAYLSDLKTLTIACHMKGFPHVQASSKCLT